MSISMSIKELESEKSLCRDAKNKLFKVFLSDNSKFAKYCDKNRYIDLSAAEAKLGKEKVAEIKKRNRIRGSGEIDAEKIKDKGDLELLRPFTREEITQWMTLESQPENVRKEVLSSGVMTDSANAWDMISFDDMYATCAKCSLSWDKGRGCIATLMGSDSPLPELAKKYGARFIEQIPKFAEERSVFDASNAKEILQEIEMLRERLPAEGKMMVRRLTGTLERLEALAKSCSENGVRFYFS